MRSKWGIYKGCTPKKSAPRRYRSQQNQNTTARDPTASDDTQNLGVLNPTHEIPVAADRMSMSFQLDRGLFQFEFTDRHAILGVGVNAEEINIRERYQAIARLLHPDSARWKTEADKQLAVRLFSRLITHAYGQLSRQSQLQEQIIMLDLLGKRLVEQSSQIQIADPLCQQLYQKLY